MLRSLLKRLGVAKTVLLVTATAILLSLTFYVLLSMFWEGILVRGLFVAVVIPAAVAPIISYSFLKVTIELECSQADSKESQEKYRELANSLPQMVFETDKDGNFTFANLNAFDLFGYAQVDLHQGLNVVQMIIPQERDRVLQNIQEVLRGKQLNGVEFTAQRANGSTFPIIVHANRIVHAGTPVGLRGIIIDQTEHKRVEKLLRESEERFRTALEANPDPVVIYDMEGKVVFFNLSFSEVFGWTLEECQGKKIDRFVPAENRLETNITLENESTGKSPSTTETYRNTKEGKKIPVIISGATLCDRSGQPVGRIVNLRDISEHKRLQAQLQHAQKMESIGTLAGGIAHDFNNLMMAIQGYVSLMLLDLDPSHPHYEALINIEHKIQSGSKLTAQLLGYARKGKYKVRPIDLNQLIQETAETFGRMRKDITIQQNFSAALNSVLADKGQMEQVLLNLFVNSADAMPSGGKLILKSENVTYLDLVDRIYNPKPGIYVKITVADTGIGMDKETLERIFDPFFTTKEMGRGTGLGLASVYGIVKSHSGYIEVESEKGRGTTFSIYLPATTEKKLEEKEPADQIMNGNGTILLVDDEEMVLNVGARILEKLGYAVLEAKSAQDALDVFRKNKDQIDMVILDMIMPEMGGGEVYSVMKQMNSNVKVLLSSGYSIDGHAKEILQRGCDGFLQKPYNVRELSGKLREMLAA
jgi:two-component system, cell cycle sensor histidine kinase and response regulator CckA